jgi:hypothetical protein
LDAHAVFTPDDVAYLQAKYVTCQLDAVNAAQEAVDKRQLAWYGMVIIAYYYRALAPILSPYATHTGSIGVIVMEPPSSWLTICYSPSAIQILNV